MWKKINEFFKKHYKIYVIINLLPTIWFSLLLTYFGIPLGLVKVDIDGNKTLTKLGITLTFFALIITLLINLVKSYIERKLNLMK